MERITLYCRTTSARGTTSLRFRVTNGRAVTMYYSTGRRIPNEQLAVFTPEGTIRPRVTVYNPKLKAERRVLCCYQCSVQSYEDYGDGHEERGPAGRGGQDPQPRYS